MDLSSFQNKTVPMSNEELNLLDGDSLLLELDDKTLQVGRT